MFLNAGSRRTNKLAPLIDGPNLHAAAKLLGFDVDYKRLLTEFQSRGTLLRAYYYTTIIEDQENSTIRPLIDWLDYNGYTVITKATKEFTDASGRRKVLRQFGRSMPWNLPSLSIRSCCSPATAISAHWLKQRNAAASASPWSRRIQASLR